MKYLKIFESLDEIEIAKICEKHGIKNWSINKDGLVDVDGNVNLSYEGLTKLPLHFGRVTGSFFCDNNDLTTLEGAPREVDQRFWCDRNNLTTLEGSPQEVGGDFCCQFNNLTTLEGGPKEVGGSFLCLYNNLTTLEGAPIEVSGKFFCNYNDLTTLKGAPQYIGDSVSFLPNRDLPIEFLNFLQLNRNRIDLETYILKWQKDYSIWRRDGSFNQSNFIQMMEVAQDELKNLEFPE